MTDIHAKRLRRLANNGYCADVLIAGADRIEKLEAALRVAAGYISTKEGHTDQHPQDVYDWIIQATVEKKND